MAVVHSDLIVSKVLAFVTGRYRTGVELDVDLNRFDGARLEMAEVIGQAVAPYDIGLPFTDAELIAVLDKYSQRVPEGADPRGLIVLTFDGRVGFTVGRGMIVESAGEATAIITAPEPDRYVSRWLVPEVIYMGGERWT